MARKVDLDAAGRRLLAWLETPTTDTEQDAGADEIRRNLLEGSRPKRPPITLADFPSADHAYMNLFLPSGRKPLDSDFRAAHMCVRAWRRVGLSLERSAAWLRAGAQPSDEHLVVLLMAECIDAARSRVVVVHPDSGEQLTIHEYARARARSFQWLPQPRARP